MSLESGHRKDIPVTKLDAAKRQIDTAIDLWFRNGDPVSIHTLTAAARRILLDLAEHRKGRLGLFDAELYIVPGKEKEYKKAIRAPETFFKHAEKDPDATFKFNPDGTDYYLIDCCDSFHALTGDSTKLMSAFVLRCFLFNPSLFKRDLLPGIKESNRINLRELSREDFLSVVLQSFEHHRKK
jgi:hypothetical protein